jgi:hypothetical protein
LISQPKFGNDYDSDHDDDKFHSASSSSGVSSSSGNINLKPSSSSSSSSSKSSIAQYIRQLAAHQDKKRREQRLKHRHKKESDSDGNECNQEEDDDDGFYSDPDDPWKSEFVKPRGSMDFQEPSKKESKSQPTSLSASTSYSAGFVNGRSMKFSNSRDYRCSDDDADEDRNPNKFHSSKLNTKQSSSSQYPRPLADDDDDPLMVGGAFERKQRELLEQSGNVDDFCPDNRSDTEDVSMSASESVRMKIRSIEHFRFGQARGYRAPVSLPHQISTIYDYQDAMRAVAQLDSIAQNIPGSFTMASSSK